MAVEGTRLEDRHATMAHRARWPRRPVALKRVNRRGWAIPGC